MTTTIRTLLTITLLAACTLTGWGIPHRHSGTPHTHHATCAGTHIDPEPSTPAGPAPVTVKPIDSDVPHQWSDPELPAQLPPPATTTADTRSPTPAAPSG